MKTLARSLVTELMRRSRSLVVLLCLVSSPVVAIETSGIAWQPYDDGIFERARREQRLVLLNLEAVWCHWCHVMAARTYSDPGVQALIARHFIAVKVDQDARPDLSSRYRDWGWPATIFLDADGVDLVKRAGYIGPEAFARLLQAVVDEPTPERSASRPEAVEGAVEGEGIGEVVAAVSPSLDPALRKQLLQRHLEAIDPVLGGLRTAQKRIDRDSLEYALLQAAGGDTEAARYARTTLDAARQLLDPVWGGVYQYSTGGDWKHPHFEKLLRIQAAYLRSYALAYGLWRAPQDLQTAHAIIRYVDMFLTGPEGAFLVSQDADLVPGDHGAGYFSLDDAGRRAQGTPRVDSHRYARENGMMIEALLVLYEFTGDPALLERASRAAVWVAGHRTVSRGTYRHDDQDPDGRYLADNLAMARAWLQFYRVTADRRFLQAAVHTARGMSLRFRHPEAGVVPVSEQTGPLRPKPDLEDNIAWVRFMNLLYHYSGLSEFRDAAQWSMRYIATERVALASLTEVGVLLADHELANDPLHLTIRGSKDLSSARALFDQAQRLPGFYKRIEWWDTREGPLLNPDVTYPELSRPAAFVCTQRVCSVPLYTAAEVSDFIAEHTVSVASPPVK